MDLSSIISSLGAVLTGSGWLTAIEDDYADLKHIVCLHQAGSYNVFSRLDVLVITPERDPTVAAGVCLCFLYYADPAKVHDIAELDRTIRNDNAEAIRCNCASLLHKAGIHLDEPTITMTSHPKYEKINFGLGRYITPAYHVELGFWIPSGKKICNIQTVTESFLFDSHVETIYAMRGSTSDDTKRLLLNAASDPDTEIRKAALTVLFEQLAEEYLPLLHAALEDADPGIRRLASTHFKVFRKHQSGKLLACVKPVIQDCLEQLASNDDFVRETAARSIVGVNDPKIIPLLLKLLHSDKETIWCHMAVLDALAVLDCDDLLDEFYSVLGDSDIGDYAAYLLGDKRTEKALALLLQGLGSNDKQIRLAAIKGLVRNTGAVDVLCKLVKDHDIQIRAAALSSLTGICFRLQQSSDDSGAVLTDKQKEAIAAICLVAAQDDSVAIRAKALTLFSDIAPNSAIPVVMAALKSITPAIISAEVSLETREMTEAIFSSIWTIRDKAFCEPLYHFLQSQNWKVRGETISTLIELGDDHGIPLLIEALADENWDVRSEAGRLLLKAGDQSGWEPMVAALREDVDDFYYKKYELLETIAGYCTLQAVDLFIDILSHPDTYSIDDIGIGFIITWLGNRGEVRSLPAIKKWQEQELLNCDEDLVENAIESIIKAKSGNKR